MNLFEDKFATHGGAFRDFDGPDDEDQDRYDGLDGDDIYGGVPLREREGYDSYAIYNPSTKKTVGRYISKSPYNAAMKAARRVFFPKGAKPVAAKGKKGKKGTKAPKAPKAPKVKGGYYVDPQTGEVVEVPPPATAPVVPGVPSNPYANMADNLVNSMNNALQLGSTTGGAKKKTAVANGDEFRPGGETMTFFLKKTTRGSKHELYHYSATLRYYRVPLVIRRQGVEITINYKMFVTRMDLPPSMQAMVDAKKEVAKMKAKKSVDKEKKQAKKLAEKEKKEAKKLAEKEKKEAKKLAEKEKKEAKKLAEKEKKEAKKLKALEKKEKKAKKTTEKKPKKTAEKKAKKPAEKKAKKPATKKTTEKKAKKTGTKKAPKMTGGACGSCSMFY